MAHSAPLTLLIRPVAPFRLDLTVWALRRRARNAIDHWDGTTNRRVVVIEGRPTEIVVATDVQYTFPSPRDVALGRPAKYQAIGFSRQKVELC